ncbi:MAG TPA: DUF456 domain-containing protein [Sutterella sp.]|nr:DUF456 domain-containing protein [Sutterella sp.]
MEQISNSIMSLDWWALFLWLSGLSLIVIGLIGTVVPALPGIPCIFIGIALIAWAGNFERLGWMGLTLCAVLSVVGLAVDWIAQAMGAKKAGATKYGMAGALVGTFIGLMMGIWGILFMPLVGAFVGEFIAQRNLRVAGGVGLATWLGMLVGAAIKIAIAFTLVGILCVGLFL